MTSHYAQPDANGFFGTYGGRFVAETLIPAVESLANLYDEANADPQFQQMLRQLQRDFIGRPTPIYFARRLTEHFKGAEIWFKREDLNHTGAHKINNCIGQALLTLRMGKQNIIAETGAGQHGVATAAVAANFGLQCRVYMGETDMVRQQPNVFRMNLLGAEVIPVTSGSKTLKDALNEALRDWVANVDNSHYIIGTVAGPDPYPRMVRDFQKIIGEECIAQCQQAWAADPDYIVACVGGGSNAIGIFYPYINRTSVQLIGVEAGGIDLASGQHAAPLNTGRSGVLHGNRTYLMQDEYGQILPTHSVSAGLDYPGVGPEHAWLKDVSRAQYTTASDDEALAAFNLTCQYEGILPALESSHALAHAFELAQTKPRSERILVCLSGRGDKDLASIMAEQERKTV